jgi:hypothetical protein
VAGVYLRSGESFVPMRERPYEAEDLLQALIAEHPEVLAGDADDEGGMAWVLVKRETDVPDRTDGAGRWSLDHLFLDQAGVPTLVEVKRSSDTRARREVVAQMLDYAANATAYWKVDALRAWFEAECQRAQVEPMSRLSDAFGIADYDSYWDTVKTNLAADRLRLVFVADEISPEVRSIVEYLNRQMTETEVLAIEVKQYVDDAGERQTIVPRILGQTEAARATKRGAAGRPRNWDETTFLEDLEARRGEAVAALAKSLITWANTPEDVGVIYGRGAIYGSAKAQLERDGRIVLRSFRIYSSGQVEMPLKRMEDTAARAELRRRLEEVIPSISGGPVPSFDIDVLLDDETRQAFLETIRWSFEATSQTFAN